MWVDQVDGSFGKQISEKQLEQWGSLHGFDADLRVNMKRNKLYEKLE